MPALELEDGSVLADSTLICEYLDSLQDGPKLFPASGAERWRVLRHHALANGILEAAVSAVVETLRRPEALRWPDWIDRQNDKVRRALDVLEADRAALGGNSGEAPDIAAITAAIALDYLDFRFPGLDWREGRDGLAAWHKEISGRASLQATMPVG